MSSERKPRRDALLGIGVAIAAAYAFVLLFLILKPGVPGRLDFSSLLILPLLGVAVFSWFVIPIGAAVGISLPRLVRSRRLPTAIFVSICVCLAIAAAWGVGVTLVSFLVGGRQIGWGEMGVTSGGMFPLLFAYCLPWVLAFGLNRDVRGLP